MIRGKVVNITERPMGWEYTIMISQRALVETNDPVVDSLPAGGSTVELRRILPDSGEALAAMNEIFEQPESDPLVRPVDDDEEGQSEEAKLLELIDSMERREMEAHWKKERHGKHRMYNELRRAVRWQLIEDEDG